MNLEKGPGKINLKIEKHWFSKREKRHIPNYLTNRNEDVPKF
jgi:hypothetical protein